MEIIKFLDKGTPAILLCIIIMQTIQSINIKYIRDSIEEIKKKMMYKDTCDAKHVEVDRRFDKIERKIFNGK
jgi:hypothetical protein